MLLDLAFVPSKSRKEMQFKYYDGKKWTMADGYMEAVYFSARLEKGWMEVITSNVNPYGKIDQLEGNHA